MPSPLAFSLTSSFQLQVLIEPSGNYFLYCPNLYQIFLFVLSLLYHVCYLYLFLKCWLPQLFFFILFTSFLFSVLFPFVFAILALSAWSSTSFNTYLDILSSLSLQFSNQFQCMLTMGFSILCSTSDLLSHLSLFSLDFLYILNWSFMIQGTIYIPHIY